MLRLTNRRGFALPMVVMLAAVLTAALAAAFTLSTTENRTHINDQAQIQAFSVAQSGLETFAKGAKSFGFDANAANFAEREIDTPEGSAFITAERIRPVIGTAPSLWLIKSRGVAATSRAPGAPVAERTVAQYGYWTPGEMDVLAGWTSLSGLHKTGSSGDLSGIDACPAAEGGGKKSVGGVAVPTGLYTQAGGTSPLKGEPPLRELGTQEESNQKVSVDWQSLVDGAVNADITIPGGVWPTEKFLADPNYFPTIYVKNPGGDFVLPANGRGLIIIEGNLTMNGAETWNGVMLIGGKLISKGNGTVMGAVVTGLNRKLAEPSILDANAVGNGQKTFRYHSCNVAKAMSRFGALEVYPNAWMDNWPEY